jgi:hypothetical protein
VDDVLDVRPDLSEDQAENIVAWLESNATFTDQPDILETLIRRAAEALGIGDEEEW